MRKRKQKQTKEQAAEARAGYHELAGQASKIAKNYLAEHREADEGVVYGAATGAACKYHSNAKFRVQPFEVICLWWIRHRLLVKKGETNMNGKVLTTEIKAQVLADRASGMTYGQLAEKHGISEMSVYRICAAGKAKSNGFVDAGECTEEQRKQLTEEITALTDKPENQACEAAEKASDFNAVTVPNYMLTQMSERLAAIESASKADSADFDIVNELEYMLTQLCEMLHNRFGEFRILAASAEDNSAVIKYRTADGLMKLEISRCE